MKIRVYMVIDDPLNKRLDIVAVINQLRVSDRLGSLELSSQLDTSSDIILGVSGKGYDVEKNRGTVITERDIIRAFLTWLADINQL